MLNSGCKQQQVDLKAKEGSKEGKGTEVINESETNGGTDSTPPPPPSVACCSPSVTTWKGEKTARGKLRKYLGGNKVWPPESEGVGEKVGARETSSSSSLLLRNNCGRSSKT